MSEVSAMVSHGTPCAAQRAQAYHHRQCDGTDKEVCIVPFCDSSHVVQDSANASLGATSPIHPTTHPVIHPSNCSDYILNIRTVDPGAFPDIMDGERRAGAVGRV